MPHTQFSSLRSEEKVPQASVDSDGPSSYLADAHLPNPGLNRLMHNADPTGQIEGSFTYTILLQAKIISSLRLLAWSVNADSLWDFRGP